MLYTVVLVSAIQQSESAISIHISPPSKTSLPPQHTHSFTHLVITEHQAESENEIDESDPSLQVFAIGLGRFWPLF